MISGLPLCYHTLYLGCMATVSLYYQSAAKVCGATAMVAHVQHCSLTRYTQHTSNVLLLLCVYLKNCFVLFYFVLFYFTLYF